MNLFKILSIIVGSTLLLSASGSEDIKVKITEDIPYVDVDVMGGAVRIQRIQDLNHKLTNSYAKTDSVHLFVYSRLSQ